MGHRRARMARPRPRVRKVPGAASGQLASQRHDAFAGSAVGAASKAVDAVTNRRHRERGLNRNETEYAQLVFLWLVNPWRVDTNLLEPGERAWRVADRTVQEADA
jgi:hypothetical protein